jgi:hypothetical protein
MPGEIPKRSTVNAECRQKPGAFRPVVDLTACGTGQVADRGAIDVLTAILRNWRAYYLGLRNFRMNWSVCPRID